MNVQKTGSKNSMLKKAYKLWVILPTGHNAFTSHLLTKKNKSSSVKANKHLQVYKK